MTSALVVCLEKLKKSCSEKESNRQVSPHGKNHKTKTLFFFAESGAVSLYNVANSVALSVAKFMSKSSACHANAYWITHFGPTAMQSTDLCEISTPPCTRSNDTVVKAFNNLSLVPRCNKIISSTETI